MCQGKDSNFALKKKHIQLFKNMKENSQKQNFNGYNKL